MTVKRNAALGFIFVTILIDVIGLGIIIPVIPKLIEGLSGGGLSEASKSGGWMMFAFLVPYCLGGIAGPALQGIISNQVPANEQGEWKTDDAD